MDYQIRLATTDDLAELARLRHAFRSTLSAPNEDEVAFLARCTAWMSEHLGNGHWYCWVAAGAAGLLGNVWLQLVEKIPTPTDEPEEHAYLTNFFVLKGARGSGIGSEMLSRLLEWSARREVHAVFLWPTTRTRGLYERHGFMADGDVMQILFVPRAK